MKDFDKDKDAKLSAYAFGELSGDAKREVELLLENDADARAEVEELRAFTGMLKDELSKEPVGELNAERVAAVLGERKVLRPDNFSRFSKRIALFALAGCLCMMTVVGMHRLLRPELEVEAESAPAAVAEPVTEEAIAEQRDNVEKARIKMIDMMEKYDIVDAAGDKPEWMRGAMPESDRAIPEPMGASDEKLQKPMEEASEIQSALVPNEGKIAEIDSRPKDAFRERLAASPEMEGRESKVGNKTLQSTPEQPSSVPAPAAVAKPSPERTTTDAPMSRSKMLSSVDESWETKGRNEAKPSDAYSDYSVAGKEELPTRGKAINPDPIGDGFGAGSFRSRPVAGGEDYGVLKDNAFKQAIREPLSTFSIDVDTGAYSNTRRFVMKQGQLPPKDAVRIEEMINYFDYDYPQPEDGRPFSVNVEVADCPWAPEFRLVKVGLKGTEMHVDERPASNLVFLIDVSGSMDSADKLPLLKESMIALTKKLGEKDRVGMVVYAGNSGVVLKPTPGSEQKTITKALERLKAGGSTNGGQGIELAYRLAKENFIEGGVNRVILASDGDFNVGMTNTESLISMVEAKAREDAIFLTVLGFGDGNLKESRMEQIANKGNGNYYYIDNAKEGRRVLVDRLSSTLVAIAKDVKIQVDFNPGQVSDYRLIGYANRMLKAEDFRDDTKDAGEIGAGHTVTALYQVLPASSERAQNLAAAHKSKYVADGDEVKAEPAVELIDSPEMLTVKLRYKKPAEDTSVEFELPVIDKETKWQDASGDFKFAAAVAGYGMVLRESEHKGTLNLDKVRKMAEEGRGSDSHGLRQEFIDMVTRSMALSR